MEMRKRKWWRICVLLVIVLTVIGYTPLVIPDHVGVLRLDLALYAFLVVSALALTFFERKQMA